MLLKDLWIQDVQDTGVGGDVPTSYAHHKKKCGFAPVVVIPAVRELYGKSLQFVAIPFLALNICIYLLATTLKYFLKLFNMMESVCFLISSSLEYQIGREDVETLSTSWGTLNPTIFIFEVTFLRLLRLSLMTAKVSG